ncbi:hypothetical protein NR798_37140 [Archangium gephyra]|uniref:hypothetical protein n=1 Tax=Archangium gephyra TaxID=48 RepID=UPI0035D407EC
MRSLLPGLVLTLLAASGAAHAQSACDPTPLLDGVPSHLRVLLSAGASDAPLKKADGKELTEAERDAARDAALEALDTLLSTCDWRAELVPPPGVGLVSPYAQTIPFERTLRDALSGFETASPILSQVLNAPGTGIPLPQRIQLGLSQVTTAGQPGLSFGGAGVIDPTSPHAFFRHSNLAISVLAIQPVGTGSGTDASTLPSSPELASAEIAFTHRGEETAYDWMARLADASGHIAMVKEENRSGYFATQNLLATYGSARDVFEAANEATAPEARARLWKDTERRNALVAAAEIALQIYRSRLKDFLQAGAVADAVRRATNPVSFHWAVRFRTTPGLRFIPEVPDARSLSLEGVIEGAFGAQPRSRRAPIRYNLGGALSGSAIPRDPCVQSPRPGECSFANSLGVVLDLAGGVTFDVPLSGLAAPSSIRVNGLFRWTPYRNSIVASIGEPELSYGANASLAVPVSEGLFIVGTYTYRWIQGVGPLSTTGFTITKELPR